MKSRRGNGPDRGNSAARRARKLYLLREYGDGTTCRCVHCSCELDYASLEADRVIPGSEGGSYRRENIVPSCRHCNASRGDRPLASFSVQVGRFSVSAEVTR